MKNLKINICLLSVLLFSQAVFAQSGDTSGVSVIKSDFAIAGNGRTYGAYNYTEPRAGNAFARISQPSDSDSYFNNRSDGYWEPPRRKFQVSLVVKNTGSKTITAVTWKPALVYDNKKRSGLNQQFRVKKTILPGETLVLTKTFYRVSKVSENKDELPLIETVRYADGTKWKRK